MLNGMALARILNCGSVQDGSLSHVPMFGYVHFVCLVYFFTDVDCCKLRECVRNLVKRWRE